MHNALYIHKVYGNINSYGLIVYKQSLSYIYLMNWLSKSQY